MDFSTGKKVVTAALPDSRCCAYTDSASKNKNRHSSQKRLICPDDSPDPHTFGVLLTASIIPPISLLTFFLPRPACVRVQKPCVLRVQCALAKTLSKTGL
jgi:hypothetical protein